MKFFDYLYNMLIADEQYMIILKGLGNTLVIAAVAAVIGIVLGMLVSMLKYFCRGRKALKPLEWLCNAYVTAIRGTPVMVQLFIWSTVILLSWKNTLPIACIGFGFNSGAYVAEIIRAGIAAVDPGQEEASRSLGLSKMATMRYVIMPQAIKNCLPALVNEMITLLKETSICGYIGLNDLTRGGDIIRSITYDPMLPLIGVAIIYLVMVMGLSQLVKKLERRLRNNER